MAGVNVRKKISLELGCLNVNSMNVSTLGTRNSKSFLKIEGITQLKHDVLFLCDIRLKGKENDIGRMLGLNRNASYKLYANSDRDSRGVAVAIKRKIVHEIIEIYRSQDQNIILLKTKIKGEVIVLGAVYGPNENNPGFFTNLRETLQTWNLPYIIGGDFNTILDNSPGDVNLDRTGQGRVPNSRNSLILNDWILNGDCIEPFRALYPEQKEISYVPFRIDRGGWESMVKRGWIFFL